MAVTVSSARGGAKRVNSTDSDTYVSNSQVWTATSLWIVVVHNDHATSAGTPTLASNSPVTIAWTQQDTQAFNGGLNQTTAFTGLGDGHTGTITANFGATQLGCNIDVLEVTGGYAATGYVVQAVSAAGSSTSPNVGTVSSWSDATNNAGILNVAQADQANTTAEAGWTEIEADIQHSVAPIGRNADFYRVGEDTTPTATLAWSAPWGAIFIEIGATEATPGTGTLPRLGRAIGTSQASRRAARW